MGYMPMEPSRNTRYYGGNGTIHGSTIVNVETRNGKVVSVWFRCLALPFDQSECDQQRADDMVKMYADNTPSLIDGITTMIEDDGA